MSTTQDHESTYCPAGLSSEAEYVYKRLFAIYTQVGTELRMDRLRLHGEFSIRTGFRELMADGHIVVTDGCVWFAGETDNYWPTSTAAFDKITLNWQKGDISNSAIGFINTAAYLR